MTSYDFSKVIQAVQAIAGVCDYARNEDGVGFNGVDAGFGHKLAETPAKRWSPKMALAAIRMLKKYTRQLASHGIDYNAIPVPTEEQILAKRVVYQTKPRAVAFVNGTVEFSFDYRDPQFRSMVDSVKAIPGRRWDPIRKVWTAQLNKVSVEAVLFTVREYDFSAPQDLEDRAAELVGVVRKNVTASRAASAEFNVQGLGGELRPFQKAGVAYAVANKRVIIGDEMGLGKTVQALATFQALKSFPAIIVCPASLKINWQREASKWLPGKTVEVLNGKVGQYNADITVVNYENIAKHTEALLKMGFKAIACDEFHYCKNPKAKRSQAVEEIAKNIDIRLGLTGTPVVNRPAELAHQLKILGRLDDIGGWKRLMFHYAGMYNNGYGLVAGEPKDLDELNVRLRASCYIRRLKKEVLTELPEKTRSSIWLKLDGDDYQKAERKFAESLDEQDCPSYHITEITRLRKLAAEKKLTAAIEWISDFLDSGEKLVVFAHHISIQDAVANAFPGCAVLRGDDANEVRQANVDRFQKDPDCRLIVCSLKAGGVGHTLTAASNVCFIEQGWTPGDMSQAEDRVHRIGQKNAVNAWYLLAVDSIDEWMYDLLLEKAKVVNATTEGHELTEVAVIKSLVTKLKAKYA